MPQKMLSSDVERVRRKPSERSTSVTTRPVSLQELDPIHAARTADRGVYAHDSLRSQLAATALQPRGRSPIPGRAVPETPAPSSSKLSSYSYLSRPMSTSRPSSITPSRSMQRPRALPSTAISSISSQKSPQATPSFRVYPSNHDKSNSSSDHSDESGESTARFSSRDPPSTSSPYSSTSSFYRSSSRDGRQSANGHGGYASLERRLGSSEPTSPMDSTSRSFRGTPYSSISSSTFHSDSTERSGRRGSIEERTPRKSGEPRGLVGLSNLGNTCFLNSCLQCLRHTRPLLLASMDRDPASVTGNMSHAFVSIVCALWTQPPHSVATPRTVLSSLEVVAPQFSGYRQHDSQEVLRALLEQMDMEQNRVQVKPPYKELETDGLPEEVLARRAWEYHRSRHDSLIQDSFCGQLQSTIECGSCRWRSHCFDPFLDISLPIPKNLTRKVTLDDCIRTFAQEERLDGVDKYHCPRCKGPRPCIKQLRFFRLPPMLVIHLKRFCGARFSLFAKDATLVHFPLTGFDMRDYLGDAATYASERPPIYDLYAVSNHSGSLGSGHYTAYCKNPDKSWYSFNDTRVSQISESAVVSSSAYLLFYQIRVP